MRAVILAILLLTGCGPSQTAHFYTTADIALRSGEGDDSRVVAILPRGTEVVPAGRVGSECGSCWKVDTPAGTGWVYTSYLTMQLSDIQP